MVYDSRETSPTYGSVNEFKVNERSPGLLVIPPDLFHGWKNLGVDEAFILSMPSRPFAYEGPDVYLMPYDAPDADVVVPSAGERPGRIAVPNRADAGPERAGDRAARVDGPLVTVIIPTYEHASTLDLAVASRCCHPQTRALHSRW